MKVLLQICGVLRRVCYDILLPIAIIFLIVVAGYYVLMKFAPEADKVADEFPTFVKLLTVILAALIAIGIALFWGILRLTRDSVEKDLQKQFSQIRGKLAISMGFNLYCVKQYDLAIKRTKDAVNENLTELDKTVALANLAYYYALKHEQHDLSEVERKEAKKWAKLIYNKYDRWKEGYNRQDWVETYTFVMSRLAQGQQEREKTEQEIKDLLQRPELEKIQDDLKLNLKHLESRHQEE